MANSVTTLVPKIIAARGLAFLRENAVTPRLVQNLSDGIIGQKGQVITLPDSAALTVTNVTVGATPPAPTAVTIASKTLTLGSWVKVGFGVTDKELHEVAYNEHFIPSEMEEAMRAMGNNVDSALLALYKGVANFSGTAGTTPFATNLNAFRDARALLNKDNAILNGRNVILDPDAEANAVVLEQFLAADRAGSNSAILNGEIGPKLGANWYMNQNVPTHTVGTWACAATCGTEIKTSVAVGVSTIVIQGTSVTTTIGGTVLAGDVFYIEGHDQPYVVKTGGTVAAASNATLSIVISPPLRAGAPAAKLVTFYAAVTATNSDLSDVADPTVNLLFHPKAFGFASRPMASSASFMGSQGNYTSVVRDPLTGISMRMEVIREYKQWLIEFDMLYGVKLLRPELACRIHG